MTEAPAFVRRATVVLRPDPSRVISRLFLPGQELLARGISRADAVIQRVLAMTDEAVADTLAATVRRFSDRHDDLAGVFAEHFALVAHRLPATATASPERRDLIGAYFTQEYSVEAAALFNPSIVAHPDQTGLAAGELRFIMSVRAVGEGHISCIKFRTGVVTDHNVRIDDPGRHLVTGRAAPASMSREFLRNALAERVDTTAADDILDLLPPRFDAGDLDAAVGSVQRDALTRASAREIIERIRWIASCNYQLRFDDRRPLAERVIFPVGPDESNGVEDARFTRFVDDGNSTYYAKHGALSAPGRRPLSCPVAVGSGEHRHRRLDRRLYLGRRGHSGRTRMAVGAHSTGKLRITDPNTRRLAGPHPRRGAHAHLWNRRNPARPGRAHQSNRRTVRTTTDPKRRRT